MTDDLLRTHIRAILQAEEDYDKHKEDLLSSYEAKGHRIISGGQTGHDTWDITDYRTGQIIAEGGGGLEGYGDALSSDQAERENWVHIDPITEDLYMSEPVTEGLPESLCEALSHWVREQADDEDIAMVLGEE